MSTLNSENQTASALSVTPTLNSIFLVSILSLFLEVMLIRWIGTEVRIFAYLQNAVLVVCFMGLGIGCLTCRKPVKPSRILIPIICLLLIFAIPYLKAIFVSVSLRLSVLSDFLIWYRAIAEGTAEKVVQVILGLILTFVLMQLLWNIFVPLGRVTGALLEEYPNPILAYSVNILGSLVGVWLFSLFSAVFAPPTIWFLTVALLLFLLLKRTLLKERLSLALLLAVLPLSWLASKEPDAIKVVWSPYQKLALQTEARPHSYALQVNNVSYQGLVDLSAQTTTSHPEIFEPDLYGYTQYDLPFLLHANPRKVLIVGAGAGNDASGALRNAKVEDITGVEIDPAIIEMGQHFHPEQPYHSPKLKLVVNDARAFFSSTKERFDVISFGLLDSHTTTSLTNARLDHYVYTKESLTQVKELLNNGGIVILSFYAVVPFITDRIARALKEVFNEEPIVFRVPHSGYGGGNTMFISGDLHTVNSAIAADKKLGELITAWKAHTLDNPTYTTEVATDDWPYLYLAGRTIPVLYFLLGILLVLLFISSSEGRNAMFGIFKWRRNDWHFFSMGAAFLLLEVQNISKASVALGNTWQVNGVIISAILIMILISNLLVYRFQNIPVLLPYLCILCSCIFLYFIDLAQFVSWPYFSRAIAVGGLTALPVLFSGMVFIRSFVSAPSKHAALGVNLFGSLVGGLLQTITFVSGIKFLLILVAGLYAFAFWTRPKPQPA